MGRRARWTGRDPRGRGLPPEGRRPGAGPHLARDCRSLLVLRQGLALQRAERVRARAGYEITLDPDHGMVLRLGVQDRYDSSPGPAKRNDVNYFVTLLFKF